MACADGVFSLTAVSAALVDHHKKQFTRKKTLQIVPRRIDLYSTKKKGRNTTCQGDYLLAKIRSALNFYDSTNEYERSAHQRKFHESMLAASIRHIYSDEFSENFLKILEDNNWESARQEILICCPRRFGKTWAVGMFVAAYLYAIPDAEICIFSPSRRQSEKMLELVRTFLLKLPNMAESVEKSNRERMWVRGNNSPTDIRKVSSYPSKVSTLKGVGGDLIVCEEAAAMDTAVFYEVCCSTDHPCSVRILLHGVERHHVEDNRLERAAHCRDERAQPAAAVRRRRRCVHCGEDVFLHGLVRGQGGQKQQREIPRPRCRRKVQQVVEPVAVMVQKERRQRHRQAVDVALAE